MKSLQHLSEQPLYETLKQYKIIGIISLCFIGYLILDVWGWFKLNSIDISTEATAAVFAFLGILMPIFKWTISYIGDKSDRND